MRLILLSLLFSTTHFHVFSQNTKKDTISVISPIYGSSEESFAGPFDSWYNVKKDFGAIGDGKTDDTKAIQNAFDSLKLNKKKVVFFPKGIYKITASLNLVSLLNISIIGEDPKNTSIIWYGENGGTMLDCNGVSYSRFGRITWDGQGKAKCAVNHGWDGKRPNANTYGEHADEIYKDVAFGIRGGSRGKMDAECVVKRCRFFNCSQAGISVENFNAADWEIWYCTFIHCNIGVTNKFGAGYFNVFNSYFSGSTYADISKYHCGFYAFRHNTSIHSKKFLVVENHDCPGLVTIQGNNIYETNDATAIQVGDEGPTLLMDNTILSKESNIHLPSITIAKGETCTSIGNIFNSKIPYSVYRSEDTVYTIEDKMLSSDKIKVALPTMPEFAKSEKFTLFEVPKNANDSIIQAIIQKASHKFNPLIHFANNKYVIKKTIILPAKLKMTLVGDGHESRLEWQNTSPGTMFELEGPSHIVIKELRFLGKSIANGIHIDNCDHKNAQIILDQVAARGSNEAGFLSDSLDYTAIYLFNGYHSGSKKVAVKAIGGNRISKGEKTTGKFCLFSGASSSNISSYDVTNGAEMVINDIWYEDGREEKFNIFTDSSTGKLTLCGFKVATAVKPLNKNFPDSSEAGINIKNFIGNLCLLNMQLFSRLIIHNSVNEKANILTSYTAKDSMFINYSEKANLAILDNSFFLSAGGAKAIKLNHKPDKVFILKMLEQERTFIPVPIIPQKKNITDVRMYRVSVENSNIGFKFSH